MRCAFVMFGNDYGAVARLLGPRWSAAKVRDFMESQGVLAYLYELADSAAAGLGGGGGRKGERRRRRGEHVLRSALYFLFFDVIIIIILKKRACGALVPECGRCALA